MLSLDANTTHSATGVTSTSFSHTCGSQPNRGLFVVAALEGVLVNPTSITATYNGVSMTSIGTANAGTAQITICAFYLAKPASGANTVALSWTTTSDIEVVARSYNGVHQGTPVLTGSFTSANFGPTTTPSLNVTTAAGDIVMDLLGVTPVTASGTAGSGQTEILDGSAGNIRGIASVEPATATPVAMSWTLSETANGVQLGFSIHAGQSAASPVISPFLAF